MRCYLQVLLIVWFICNLTESRKANYDNNVYLVNGEDNSLKSLLPLNIINQEQKQQPLSAAGHLGVNEIKRVKRKSKIKIKTHDKVIKIKPQKTKIKIYRGGGGGFGRRGALYFGAGLLGGSLLGAGLVYSAGRYGRYEFQRHGHTLVLTPSAMNVTGFNYSIEHNHYHDEHGHFLGPDGLYYDHATTQMVHDARMHVPIDTVARVESYSTYSINDHSRPLFRFYPYNVTHGIWEYSAVSVAEKVYRDHAFSLSSSSSFNLVIVNLLLLTIVNHLLNN